MILEVIKFGKFLEFFELKILKLEIFGIFQIESFQYFPNCELLDFVV